MRKILSIVAIGLASATLAFGANSLMSNEAGTCCASSLCACTCNGDKAACTCPSGCTCDNCAAGCCSAG